MDLLNQFLNRLEAYFRWIRLLRLSLVLFLKIVAFPLLSSIFAWFNPYLERALDARLPL